MLLIVLPCSDMNPINTIKTRVQEPLEEFKGPHNTAQASSLRHKKSGQQVASEKSTKGKNSSAYWAGCIYKTVTRGVESPHYSMKVAFKGRRMRFTTGTGNKESAARTAAGIYNDLLSMGVDATLAKHRPQKVAKGDSVATIGEWIEGAKEVSEANPATFTSYARALRLITSGVLAMKKTSSRFGPKNGGSTLYREAVDATSLEALSPEAIQKWRLAYVKKAKNPALERSAMTSCNSIIRQARSLFAPKVVRFLPGQKLPEPPPFAGVEFFPRQSAKYISKIDPKEFVQAASRELAKTNPAAYLGFLLAIGAGLRRNEIDSLCWHQIDTGKKVIRVEVTEVASLKTQDSRGEVEIDDDLAAILQGYKAGAKGKGYVIEATGTGGPRKWGQHYRADAAFNDLIVWLRNHKQDDKKPLEKVRKPIHELRKELGALITQEHGIYAASRTLRHSNVATTAAHYADKKERTTVNVGGWLSEKVVPIAPETPSDTPAPKFKKRR